MRDDRRYRDQTHRRGVRERGVTPTWVEDVAAALLGCGVLACVLLSLAVSLWFGAAVRRGRARR